MKRNLLKASFIAALAITSLLQAQENQLDNLKPRDKRGLTVFENPKDTVSTFDHLRVKVGGAFALQFQGINMRAMQLLFLMLQALIQTSSTL